MKAGSEIWQRAGLWSGRIGRISTAFLLPRAFRPRIARPVSRRHCWLSLILSNARALAEMVGAPPIVLLDEVAAHLDADRRSALYDEICALGAQAWMTGTGPELFVELGDRAQSLIVTEGDEGSVVAT